ncbi:hypothetical protein CQ13_07325 [Bradyrhizobium retamae]|uniref:Uncharacterized protein n=1 Tax=Bradyrhizobium retamae TaxID=1300035 RepID=A0A0R3MW07_9BRAD|nr:hypothetical protein CQ13_07325 [Bradyrhizobium retamae]
MRASISTRWPIFVLIATHLQLHLVITKMIPPSIRHHRQAVEIAERAARKAAETEAMPITVMAEAENQAANNKAETITMLAKADAEPATTRAVGVKSPGQAEAEVAALKAEARNKLSQAMIDYGLRTATSLLQMPLIRDSNCD